MEKVSDRIRILREMKGLSQENMAQELGLSQQGYSALERKGAGMRLRQLAEVSTVLGVSVDVILSPASFFSEKEVSVSDPKILSLQIEVELLREKVKLQELLQFPPPMN